MRVLRNLDLIVLALALPVWVAMELPFLGWAAASGAWLASRGIQSLAERRARESGKRQVALGARAASLIARLYLCSLAVLVAGVIDRESGLTAGILSVAVFTVYFCTLFIVKPLEEAGE